MGTWVSVWVSTWVSVCVRSTYLYLSGGYAGCMTCVPSVGTTGWLDEVGMSDVCVVE